MMMFAIISVASCTALQPALPHGANAASLSTVADSLKTAQNVVVMVGAGVSVSAGIPDFRTPGTGLYDNLQEYGLPDPQAIFDLNFFSTNPQPFYRLCKELWPGQHEPTKAHHFIKLLDNKGMLRRCYSQNIDSLESTAGLPAEKLVAAHGNFDSATVRRDDGSSAAVPVDEVRVAAATEGMAGWDALNAKHGGLVKPDIVFFGEQLPGRFFSLLRDDFPACDLLIVMGTSLAVYPFAALIAQVSPDTPRLLVNRERVGDGALGGPIGPSGAFDFDGAQSMDRFYQGDCDDACEELARRLGWSEELDALRRPTVASAQVRPQEEIEQARKEVAEAREAQEVQEALLRLAAEARAVEALAAEAAAEAAAQAVEALAAEVAAEAAALEAQAVAAESAAQEVAAQAAAAAAAAEATAEAAAAAAAATAEAEAAAEATAAAAAAAATAEAEAAAEAEAEAEAKAAAAEDAASEAAAEAAAAAATAAAPRRPGRAAARAGAAPTRKSKSATWLSVDEIREQMRSDPKDKPLKVWGKEPL